MLKKRLCLVLALMIPVFGYAGLTYGSDTVQTMSFSPISYTLVIDAGHGGEDGGAVSITGVPESQINLAIALKLEDTLALYGLAPKMLRREDTSLHDESAATIREKKVSDLHNRAAMVKETENPLLISIHQNTYTDARYHGAQVFFAPTPGSRDIACKTQQDLSRNLDPFNLREAKQIPDTVYLMNHVTCPAILVECGFLTHPEEETLLRQDDYQRKLAASLTGTLLTACETILQETSV